MVVPDSDSSVVVGVLDAVEIISGIGNTNKFSAAQSTRSAAFEKSTGSTGCLPTPTNRIVAIGAASVTNACCSGPVGVDSTASIVPSTPESSDGRMTKSPCASAIPWGISIRTRQSPYKANSGFCVSEKFGFYYAFYPPES